MPDSRVRRHGPLLLLLVVAGASLYWLALSSYGPFWDAAIYLLTAKSLAAGEGYRLLGDPHTLRAPGFPAMVAVVLRGFGIDFFALNLFVSLCGLAAVAGLFVYARPRVGTLVALAVCALLWVNPCFRRLSNLVMSDLPGLAALFACLLLERRARTATGRATGWVALVACAVVVAVYIRSAYTLLVPAIAASWAFRPFADGARLGGRLARIAIVAGIVVAALAPWELWKRANPAPIPSETAGVYSFMTGLLHEDAGDPRSPRLPWSALEARVEQRVGQCATGLGSRLQRHEDDTVAFWLGVAAVAALVVTFLVRRDAASAFAILSTMALLVFNDWSYRLMLGIFAISVLAILHGLRRGLEKVRVPRTAARVGLTIAVAALAAYDADSGKNEWVEKRHRANVKVVEYIREHYPRDTPIAASLGHTIAPYFQRPVWFLEIRIARGGVEGALELLREKGVELFIHTGSQNGWRVRFLDNILMGAKPVAVADEVTVYELGPRPPIAIRAGVHSVQAAIDWAIDGDEIHCGPGVYRGNIDFKGKAIALIAVAGSERTSLVGTADAPVVTFASGEGEGSVLRGFTILGESTAEAGGAICRGTSPTIEGNVFAMCRGRLGGAIACLEGGAPVIRGNRFHLCRGGRVEGVYVGEGVRAKLDDNR